MKKKLMATLTLVMAICSALFVGTAFSASADGYQMFEIPVSETPSYPRMDGTSAELFSYVAEPIEWDSTESIQIKYVLANGGYISGARHWAIVMNDIGTKDAPDYTKLKFSQSGQFYSGIQFDFTTNGDWNGCFQMAVFGGAAQLNAGAYSHGWDNQFAADETKGTKESGSSVQNLATLMYYTNEVTLTVTRDAEYYNFNFKSDNAGAPTDYTFSVKRNCVTGSGDYANAPYIGFYCVDSNAEKTTDMGYNINSVAIAKKAPQVFNRITVPYEYKTMLAGDEADYEATVEIVDGSSSDSTEVVYTSTNEQVAKVENGKLVCGKEGTAIVKATTADGVSAETTVNVVATKGESDLKYEHNYDDMTTVVPVKDGFMYSANLSMAAGAADYSACKLYIDEPLSVNKFISFDFTPVIEKKWVGSATYFNFILNDLYDAKLGGANIDKVNINDPATSGLNGMQFRFFSDAGWAGWDYCMQYVKIAKDGNYKVGEQDYSASLSDPKVNAVTKNIWNDKKINVRVDSTADKYILTLTAYGDDGALTDNFWKLEYPKSLVDFPHNPYFGIMVNNYGANAQNIGYVITNFVNGYVDTLEIVESSDKPYELFIGENAALTVRQTYKVTPDESFDTSVTWISSDETIAAIGEGGKIIGKKPGNAVITATDSEGNTATCDVAIDVRSFEVTSEKTINAIYGEEGATIVAVVDPADVKIIYKSSDESVVTVENGKLTYVGVGTAKITVSAGLKSVTIDVTVDVASLTLNHEQLELDKFDTITLRAECGGAPGVTFESSDETVATVDASGKITAVGSGTAIITAKIGSKQATCTVTVKADGESGESGNSGESGKESSSGCLGSIASQALALPAVMSVFGLVLAAKKRKDN